jgi:hypothetical protein
MLLPKLPTDNLYKFLTFSGLVLIISSFFPFYFSYHLDISSQIVTGKIKKLELKSKLIDRSLNDLENSILNVMENVGSHDTIADKDLLPEKHSEDQKNSVSSLGYSIIFLNKWLSDNKNQIEPSLEAMIKDVLKRHSDIVNRLRDNTFLLIDLQTETNIQNRQSNLLKVVCSVAILILVSGVTISAYGFRQWYHRLQKYQDMLIMKEGNKTLDM